MQRIIITGGQKLKGSVSVNGAKNFALKALVAACLTSEEVVLHNVPLISDLSIMLSIIRELGGRTILNDHTVRVCAKEMYSRPLPLDEAASIRASIMFIAPLLARFYKAAIPDPGGDRIGARPIDRIVDGLKVMGTVVNYSEEDGYFYANTDGLVGTTYTFKKNTHTGTETLILAAVLAKGITILKNAAEEPEIDELIALLVKMGAQITRSAKREITIYGVKKLHGVEFTICPDRNEIITFAVAALATKGEIIINETKGVKIESFLNKVSQAGGGFKVQNNAIRFYWKKDLLATSVITQIHPGFMTDWQAPWAVLMTQAKGISYIHETIFENRFGYVRYLQRMGARITFYNPAVNDIDRMYNFNLHDDDPLFKRAIAVAGPAQLHNAVVKMSDLRAGATLVLAALIAKGTSVIFGVEQLDRGYENFENRLHALGATIKRI